MLELSGHPVLTGDPAVSRGLDARLDQVAALGEPLRRALYRFVAAQSEPVSREQAAAGVGIARHTAKFHLDRLVDDGLLDAGYRRPPGRGGPGAGRPAKVYRRTDTDVDVSLPERRYDLAGRLLIKAIALAARTETPVADALRTVATDEGRIVGTGAVKRGRRSPREVVEDAIIDTLTDGGYQPCPAGDGITLTNCPFHALAREETELVCGMNLAYLEGMLDGGAAAFLNARLDPADGRCCVRLQRR